MLLKIENHTFEVECSLPEGEHYVELGYSGEIKEINGEEEGWFISGLPILRIKKGNGVYVKQYDELISKLEGSSFWCLELIGDLKHEVA